MKILCPTQVNKTSVKSQNLESDVHTIIRKGSFYRKSDQRRIIRFFCKTCLKQFSRATFDAAYRQKRRDINEDVYLYICSGVSQRRLAKNLGVNRKTIVRKFRFIAHQARLEHAQRVEELKARPITAVQFDDLETSEHTKLKPLSVTLAVDKNTREILEFQVSRMPAKGHLSGIAKKKYGKRADERPKAWDQFFRNLKPIVTPNAFFESDENPHYPKFLKRHFPKAKHRAYKGARGAVVGQGELKKLKFDPLFALNHTCAMLRANLNRLFRKTWCTTKTIQGLIDHISIYVIMHNQNILNLGAG